MMFALFRRLKRRNKEAYTFVVGSPEGNYIVDTSTEPWTCEPLTDLFQPVSHSSHASDE